MPSLSVEEKARLTVAKKEEWAAKSYGERLDILKTIRTNLEKHGEEWREAMCEQRSYGPEIPHLQAEALLLGPVMMGLFVTFLIDTYESFVKTGKAMQPATRSIGDQKAAKVFPYTGLFKAFSGGLEVETWVEPGKDVETFDPTKKEAGVKTILSAGNFESAGDVLTTLFVENQVCLMKANPVNEKTLPIIEKVLGPLVEGGYVASFTGDVSVGQALLKVEESNGLLLTGSHHSVNRIVWGDPKEQKNNMETCCKKYSKEVEAELGSVNTFLITPAKWTDKQLDQQAENLVCCKMANAGHICASPQVIITDASWPQRERFLERVRYFLGKYPAVRTYYPNSERMWKAHREHVDDGDVVEAPKIDSKLNDQFDRIFKIGIDETHYATQNEAFCSVLTEMPLTLPEGSGPMDFLKKAVEVANDKIWGTLTGTIIIDDKTKKDNAEEFEKIAQSFKVGSLGINIWGGFGAIYSCAPWGAFPGHSLEDIQSGLGKVHNAMMISSPERQVLTAPFEYLASQRLPPNGALHLKTNRRLTAFMTHPSSWRLVKLFAAILGGI